MSSSACVRQFLSRELSVYGLMALVLSSSSCSKQASEPGPSTSVESASADATWKRELFVEGGDRPQLFFAVFGAFDGEPHVSRSAHRSGGVPRGVELNILRRGKDDETLVRLCSGPLWDRMRATQAAVAAAIDAAPACVVMQGEVEDARDLDYLRDAVGVVAALLEQGGAAVYDSLALLWFDAPTWMREFFEHGESRPQRHVQILLTEEDAAGRAWFHTRGCAKFGRPDLSVHCVPKSHAPAVLEMLNRFVVMQAKGALIPDGQAVKMDSLPTGGVCRSAGSLDDPNFNNAHFEISWPAGSDLSCGN